MTGKRFALGDAAIDLAAGRVRAPDGTETELRVQSAEVLRALAARRGETVTKDELHHAVWGDIAVTDDSLVQCIGDIRRAFGAARDAVQTVRGRGYRLAAEGEAVPRIPRRRPRFMAMGALAVLAIAGTILWSLRDGPQGAAAPPAATGPAVAVLPFENQSEPGRWDRLARGLTEEVIADLAANSWIFVLADATTRQHTGETPQAVGKALGPYRVVTGTVQAEGDRVRVTAALADAASGRQLWAKQWDGPTGDLLAIQAAASEALVGELAGRYWGALARANRPAARGAGTASLRAYELFLLGTGNIAVGLNMDEGYLRQAVEIDPHFARAWVALANIQGLREAGVTTRAELDRFEENRRAFLARAVEADPDDSGTLIEVAKQAARDGDPEAVARALRRAVERAPNDADILAAAARSGPEGAPLGPEALGWAERAMALNPHGPAWYRIALGVPAFAVGDYARAAEALASNPSHSSDRLLYLAAAEAMLGHTHRARQAADRLRELVPGFNLAFYMDGWPWEPGLRARLHDGAVRAGLDKPAG